MITARLEGFNNTQATRADGLSLSIADWLESSAQNNQYRPHDRSATGEATRNREGVVGAPKTPADASATITRNTDVISYSSTGGVLHIPKEIDGVNLPTDDNSQVQAMPKAQEIPKEPGLATPEQVPTLPVDPITEACENSAPGTGPWAEPGAQICPGPGIRSNPASGRPLSDTLGQ